MVTTLVDQRRRALRHRNAVLRRCRVYFPPEEIDLPILHDAEIVCDLREHDQARYDAVIHGALFSALLH